MRSQLEQYQITLRMQFRNHNLTTNILHIRALPSVFDPSHPPPESRPCQRTDRTKIRTNFSAHETNTAKRLCAATTRYQWPGLVQNHSISSASHPFDRGTPSTSLALFRLDRAIIFSILFFATNEWYEEWNTTKRMHHSFHSGSTSAQQ